MAVSQSSIIIQLCEQYKGVTLCLFCLVNVAQVDALDCICGIPLPLIPQVDIYLHALQSLPSLTERGVCNTVYRPVVRVSMCYIRPYIELEYIIIQLTHTHGHIIYSTMTSLYMHAHTYVISSRGEFCQKCKYSCTQWLLMFTCFRGNECLHWNHHGYQYAPFATHCRRQLKGLFKPSSLDCSTPVLLPER